MLDHPHVPYTFVQQGVRWTAWKLEWEYSEQRCFRWVKCTATLSPFGQYIPQTEEARMPRTFLWGKQRRLPDGQYAYLN